MIFAVFCRINSVRVVYDRREVKTVKKKTWKQIMAAGLTAGMLLAGSVQPVFAESDNLMDVILTEEIDDTELTDEETTEDFAEDTSYSLLRGTNLNLGSVKIQRMGSNEIGVFGLTQCHKTCSMQIPAHLTTHSAKSRSVFLDITERVSASADQ